MIEQSTQSAELLTILKELEDLRKEVNLLSAQLAAIKPTRLRQFSRPAPQSQALDKLNTLPLTAFPQRKKNPTIIKRVIVLLSPHHQQHRIFALNDAGQPISGLCGPLNECGPLIRAEDPGLVWETRYPQQ